jgi:hypothetical protein
LKRYAAYIPLFLLLGAFVVLLPACGGNEIKGQKPPETVLNAEATPNAQNGQSINLENGSQPKNNFNFNTATQPVSKSVARSYKQKIARIKGPQSVQTVQVMTTSTPQTTPTVVTTSTQPQPPMEGNANQKPKHGSHWFLWLVVLALLGGGAYWYWSHRKEDDSPYQPQPPVGGLSPVSGFTARKKLPEPRKTSFWKRNLF